MPTISFHLLMMALFFQIVKAMPESIAPHNWQPPLDTPSTLPYPPMDGPGRNPFSIGDNMMQPPAGSQEAYCQMLLQAPVPVPPDQIPWFCMCTQCQSSHGPKGDRGDRGLLGHPGSPGKRGLTGFKGPPGFVGRSGIKGQKGDDGEKGHQGPSGQVGPKGARGFKGDKGDQGLEGRTGEQGFKGVDGVCSNTCESSQGPRGTSGLPGPAGSRGLPGSAGPQGPKGDMGDEGSLGPTGVFGPVGEKGDLGPQGECNCTDGVDGSPGQRGDKGDKGELGQKGPAGGGGLKGDTGDPGLMGMMGRPGPCMPIIQSAFAAGLTSSYPPPNTPVVFSQTLYNVQGSYDPTTGIYTAPINGTYSFSYHLTVHERVLKVGLFHNFVPIVITTDPKTFGTTSHSILLHLARGDRVWIQVKDSVTNGMYAGTEASSTFSGFLLHPDTCHMASLRGPVTPMGRVEGEYSWGNIPLTSTTPAGGGSK